MADPVDDASDRPAPAALARPETPPDPQPATEKASSATAETASAGRPPQAPDATTPPPPTIYPLPNDRPSLLSLGTPRPQAVELLSTPPTARQAMPTTPPTSSRSYCGGPVTQVPRGQGSSSGRRKSGWPGTTRTAGSAHDQARDHPGHRLPRPSGPADVGAWVDPAASHLGVRPWVRPAVSAAVDALAELQRREPTWPQGPLHADPAPEAFRHDAATGHCGIIDWSSAHYGPLQTPAARCYSATVPSRPRTARPGSRWRA